MNKLLIRRGKRLYTPTPAGWPARDVISLQGKAYREWKPTQSKLAAALLKGLTLTLREDASILYLGAATGTTVSHLASLIPEGSILAIEFARIPYAQLSTLVKQYYPNVIPLLRDARHPEAYAAYATAYDLIIQDIAQPDQARILTENARYYADPTTIILLAVKAKSIDATRPARAVYAKVEEELKEHFTIHWKSRLEPYEQDHMFYKLTLKP